MAAVPTTTTNTITSISPIAFKVELKFGDQASTFHRFSGRYNDFTELSAVISNLWAEKGSSSNDPTKSKDGSSNSLALFYVDDEDDCVRISHQVEWEECVRIFSSRSSAKVLRLTGMPMKDCNSKKKQQEMQHR